MNTEKSELEAKGNGVLSDVKRSKWFNIQQIETFVGIMNAESEMIGERKKLVILHECGDDKEALIGQLKTMISGLETNFDWFAG